jgi:hypothetical protein
LQNKYIIYEDEKTMTEDDDLKKDNDSSRFDSLQIMEVNDTEKKFINKHADELDDVENKYKFTFYYDILFHIAKQTSRILYDRVPDDYFVFGYIKGCVYAHLDNQEKIGLSDLTSEDYQDLMVNVLYHLYHFLKLEKKISTIDQDRYHSLDNPSDKKSLELIEYSEGVEAGYNDKQSQYEFENEILYGNEDFYISSGTWQLASYLAKNKKKHQFKYAHSRKNIFYKIHEHSFYTALGEPTPNNYRHWVQYYEDESYFR